MLDAINNKLITTIATGQKTRLGIDCVTPFSYLLVQSIIGKFIYKSRELKSSKEFMKV